MKCTCKYCKKEYEITEEQKELVDYHESVIEELDVDGCDDISPYRLNISINPTIYFGVGNYEEEQSLVDELYTEMCVDCKQDLVHSLKIKVEEWKKEKGVE